MMSFIMKYINGGIPEGLRELMEAQETGSVLLQS